MHLFEAVCLDLYSTRKIGAASRSVQAMPSSDRRSLRSAQIRASGRLRTKSRVRMAAPEPSHLRLKL